MAPRPRQKPAVAGSGWSWNRVENFDPAAFKSVDGAKIFRTMYSYGANSNRMVLHWGVGPLLNKSQKALVADIQNQRDISLEVEFSKECQQQGVTQVPYHDNMMPHYEYFAQSLDGCPGIEELKIYLPVTWLENSALPTLTSAGETSMKGITTLQLSNCSLSAADMSAEVKYVADNECLSRLNLSRNNIDSVDTVRALAKAIKNHPHLRHVNLAYCSLSGGDLDALKRILFACKDCESLGIGHSDFGFEGAAMVAGYLGKKSSLTAISLSAAPLDGKSSSLIAKNLGKNKSIERLSLISNGKKLSSIKIAESLTRAIANFFEKAESRLISLNLSKNRMVSKAANILIPAIKEHTSLQHLDLSNNWLDSKDRISYAWPNWTRKVIPGQERGGGRIVKSALFDTTSLEIIADSNHICDVKLSGQNGSNEKYVSRINALDISEGKKIRYKVVHAINTAKTDLVDPRNFNSIPLELMPQLLELVQQSVNFEYGSDAQVKLFVPKSPRSHQAERDEEGMVQPQAPLNRIYEIITSWNTPLLFARGAGKLKPKKKTPKTQQKKSQSKRKRRKFGDEDDDDDDEPYIPLGARKRGSKN
ncbi:hypothetical protein ACHAWO_000262 [Cyclotella atomus]|uniref:Uncharacterized protein n=1 Tax=Cyclotella atomus TaxID=382360 RepID=A0ABD3PQ53_9STRA